MYRLIKPIFWSFLFLVMMLFIDQLLVQLPPVHPAHAAVSNFYRDFRGRLIDLAFDDHQPAPKSIEAVITKQQKPDVAAQPGTKTTTAPPAEKPQRYIYSDGQGELHFTDSFEDVPEAYRGQAQPMGE